MLINLFPWRSRSFLQFFKWNPLSRSFCWHRFQLNSWKQINCFLQLFLSVNKCLCCICVIKFTLPRTRYLYASLSHFTRFNVCPRPLFWLQSIFICKRANKSSYWATVTQMNIISAHAAHLCFTLSVWLISFSTFPSLVFPDHPPTTNRQQQPLPALCLSC